MLLRIVFLSVSAFSINSFAKSNQPTFDAKLLSELKTKSLQQVFCNQPTTYQIKKSCDELSSAKISLNQKAPAIRVVSNASFTIENAGTPLEVKRTASVNIFEINKKSLNIKDYPTVLSLKEAIQKRLPRVASSSLWFNQAFAADASPDCAMPLALILKSASDQDICQAANTVSKTCNEYQNKSPSINSLIGLSSRITLRIVDAKKDGSLSANVNAGMTKEERTIFDADVTIIKSELTLLNDAMDGLDKKGSLESCPSVKDAKKSAMDDIQSCRQEIKGVMKTMENLPNDMLPQLRGTDEDLANLTAAKKSMNQQGGSTKSGAVAQ